MWNEAKLTVAVIGTILNEWLGGFNGLIQALVVFMIIDYVTGVFCAIVEKKLSSAVGAKGILQKCLIILLIGIANEIDTIILGGEDNLLRTAVIIFYLANEGISILENATRLGLPIPDKMKEILIQLKNKGR